MNERVIINPNFKNNGEFHASLRAKGVGAKDYPNTHTEVEYLGNGKLAASIGVGHRVFFDKADGNKPKKHKLTDERPAKDYVLIQGAKCCVEVYPYYAKYYDVQHEEVRLYEERWVVQRLFEEPDNWQDVDAYNPVVTVEEYSEPAGDVVKVTVTYDMDYGVLTVEYFQRNGNNLKHNVSFRNTSGSTETFRVLQRWAGIAGTKVKDQFGQTHKITGKKVLPNFVFTFKDEAGKFSISENCSALFTPYISDAVYTGAREACEQLKWALNGECNKCGKCCSELVHCPHYNPDLPDKCEIHIDKDAQMREPDEAMEDWDARRDKRCLLCFRFRFPRHIVDGCSYYHTEREVTENDTIPYTKLKPTVIDLDGNGLKADFVYGNWTLTQNESLILDPDSATLDDPTEDGFINRELPAGTYTRDKTGVTINFGKGATIKVTTYYYRGYVEWDIEGIPDGATVTKVEFRYHGVTNPTDNSYIHAMASRPSVQSDDDAGNQVIFDDAGDGTAYLSNNAVFPEVGASKDVGGASGPAWDTDPKTDVESALINDWFAFGLKTSETTESDLGVINSENKTDAPDPKPTLYVEYEPAAPPAKPPTFRLDPKPRTRARFYPSLEL